MKLMLIAVFMGLVVLFVISSCATAPKPLAPGEVRLLSMKAAEKARTNMPFVMNINFEANGEPEIRSACFYFSGDGPHCFKVTAVSYGSPGTIEVQIRTQSFGQRQLRCYAAYIRDGKIQATNEISTYVGDSTK